MTSALRKWILRQNWLQILLSAQARPHLARARLASAAAAFLRKIAIKTRQNLKRHFFSMRTLKLKFGKWGFNYWKYASRIHAKAIRSFCIPLAKRVNNRPIERYTSRLVRLAMICSKTGKVDGSCNQRRCWEINSLIWKYDQLFCQIW